MRTLAVYIHVPFCPRKCAYCDFASYAGKEALADAYFGALEDELRGCSDELSSYEIRSVFIGGGTPSYVDAERIASVLELLKHCARLAPGAELSMELNPGTPDEQKLRLYREAGINRLSIGVQSFDAQLLRTLGRIHTPEQAEHAVWLARAAGFENINIDLMYALPGQSMQTWSDTLSRALSLPITHISAYSLIVEEGTRMCEWVREGRVRLPEDEAVNEMQRMALRMLRDAGFERYEISNYARAGFECRHNISYWECGEYLGLGSAAHSLMGNARFHNPDAIEDYLSGARRLDYALRSIEDERTERLMLSTRMTRGLDLRAWERTFGECFEQLHEAALQRLLRGGFVEIQNGFLRLTTRGMEMHSSVVLELSVL